MTTDNADRTTDDAPAGDDRQPETDDDPLLWTTDLSRAFGDVRVIEDVSAGIHTGELTALVGPNGSGKTTLLRLLCGLLDPSAGTATYDGPDSSRQIGYLQQRPAFRPGFTVAETVELYATLAGTDAAGLLDRVGLADAGDRRVEALSGGMTRLLGIAQAMVGDPPVVVMDEPGTGLDPSMRRRTFRVARDLVDEETAVLLSSHDLALVGDFADRVLVLDRGRLVADGSPDTLRDDDETLWDAFERLVEQTDGVAVVGETE